MTFQIMTSAKARLAGKTHVGLFLTVSEKMTLEVMLAGKFSSTKWTAMLLI